MILISLLALLLNFSNATPVEHAACNELVHVVVDHATGQQTYTNKYRLPVVDKDGKMMFDIDFHKRGSSNKLLLTPARECRFNSEYDVIVTMVDKTQSLIKCTHAPDQKAVEIHIDNKLLAQMMNESVVSISVPGLKYDYQIILKPNQARVVQDVINCTQR